MLDIKQSSKSATHNTHIFVLSMTFKPRIVNPFEALNVGFPGPNLGRVTSSMRPSLSTTHKTSFGTLSDVFTPDCEVNGACEPPLTSLISERKMFIQKLIKSCHVTIFCPKSIRLRSKNKRWGTNFYLESI